MEDLGQYLLDGLPTPSCNAEPITRCPSCLAFSTAVQVAPGSDHVACDLLLDQIPVASALLSSIPAAVPRLHQAIWPRTPEPLSLPFLGPKALQVRIALESPWRSHPAIPHYRNAGGWRSRANKLLGMMLHKSSWCRERAQATHRDDVGSRKRDAM